MNDEGRETNVELLSNMLTSLELQLKTVERIGATLRNVMHTMRTFHSVLREHEEQFKQFNARVHALEQHHGGEV